MNISRCIHRRATEAAETNKPSYERILSWKKGRRGHNITTVVYGFFVLPHYSTG